MTRSAEEETVCVPGCGGAHNQSHKEPASNSLRVHTLAVSQAPKQSTESNNSSNMIMRSQNSCNWSEVETACSEAHTYGPDQWSGDEYAGAKMAMELHKTSEAKCDMTANSSGRLGRSVSERTHQVSLDNSTRLLARSHSKDKLKGCLNGTCAVLKACICKKGPVTASPRLMERPVINFKPNHVTSLAVAESGSDVIETATLP